MSATRAQPAAAPAPLTLEGAQILFPPLPYDAKARADRATGDEALQRAVHKATYLKSVARLQACGEAFGENYDALREHAGRIKQHTLDHLDYYLDRFVDNATAAGTQVHFAADAAQANAICLDIAKRHDCALCVKSKSMVTEETHLLPALEAIGCETVETDLGEFILQLDHDAPSHIVTPMIHKDRAAVARAFVRELGAEYTEDAAELTQIAREHLREKYRRADLGISGGNFLVADTGGVVVCTNEGNGRFCTSAPRVHVAFVGIEKLVPSAEHLNVMLKLLARSSTGQPLTVYTSVLTGPKREHEPDGPEQMHIILVDNGRSDILREETREMLRCIRCGACLNVCPVYRKVGGHSYGAVYSGPIGALITPMFRGLGNYKDLPNLSSLCGACYEACPVKIDIPKLLIQLRRDQVGTRVTGLGDRVVFRLWTLSLMHPLTYRFSGWMQKVMLRFKARLGGKLVRGDPYDARGFVHHIPGPAGGWTSQRDLPTPPARSFRQWWTRHECGNERGASRDEGTGKREERGGMRKQRV